MTLYTDGVTEARSPRGLYGEERLALLVAGLPHDPAAIVEAIAQAVWRGSPTTPATTSRSSRSPPAEP